MRRSLHGSCRSGRLPAGTFFGVLVCGWRPNIEALHWQRFPLPAELAGNTYPLLAKRLDRRFVAALADERVEPAWQIPVKLAHGRCFFLGRKLKI